MKNVIDFVHLRHGRAESNQAQERSQQQGDHSLYTETFRKRHTSAHRLLPRGIQQAVSAGQWLKQQKLVFQRAYVSDYVRAMETAGHLNLENVRWVINTSLREREAGLLDPLAEHERQERFAEYIQQATRSPFHWRPPAGESIADVVNRLRADLFQELKTLPEPGAILLVTHGRTMRALRAIVEDIPPWIYNERDRLPESSFANCQIVHYTKRDPQNPTHVSAHFDWVRTVIPWDLERLDSSWQRIERPVFSNQDLLALADRIPRLIEE